MADCTKFREMSLGFDDKKLQSLSKYATFFDFVKCHIKKAYLVGLHSSQTVWDECKSPGQLSFLAQKYVIKTVPELTKLLVLMVLAATASVEKSFSALFSKS